VMEEEDLDAVAEAWGGEDEDLIPGAPTEGLDEEMEGFEEAGANGEEDEEGGWDMEVSCHICTYMAFAHFPSDQTRCVSCCSDLCLQRFRVSFQQVLCQIHDGSKHTRDAQLSLFAVTEGVQ